MRDVSAPVSSAPAPPSSTTTAATKKMGGEGVAAIPPVTDHPDFGGSSMYPACWGHRGASAAFPENTLVSFEAAIRDGAEGIESDVHIASDGVICMFHDPYLERTTDGKGLIHHQPYNGGIDAYRTLKSPKQKIPTFDETMELLMRPENSHVVFNIDCKVDNDPDKLFTLIAKSIQRHPDWETKLAPRLVLGLWHPKYLAPARQHLPLLRRAHIGSSPSIAKKYFWSSCDAFSMSFASLVGREGEAFRKACRNEGKDLLVWTVNKRNEMIEATKWGAKAVLTDKTADFLGLRAQMGANWQQISKETTALFPYTNIWYYSFVQWITSEYESYLLARSAGPWQVPNVEVFATPAAPKAVAVS